MRELIYLDAAVDDLDDIFRHIVRESGQIEPALRFTEQLRRQCAKLASLPGVLGRAQPELLPDLRSFPYIILFRYEADTLQVVAIVEGHRNIPDMFS